MLVASMSQDAYLSRKEVNKSYRPRNYVGLASSIPLAIRVHVHRRRRRSYPQAPNARAPFRLQKVLTGVVVTGFATAVWAYSIRAIKQDDFSDVDEEAREMMKGKMTMGAASPFSSPSVGSGVSSSSSSDLDVGASDSSLGPDSTVTGVRPQSHPRGALAPMLVRTFPRLLDPTRKTLV